MDTKEKFKEEFEKTCNLVLSQFPQIQAAEMLLFLLNSAY